MRKQATRLYPLVFENPEKTGNVASADPRIPSWPFRAFVCGPVNCGKRCAVLTLIASLDRWPDRFLLAHGDPGSSEYDELNPEKFDHDEPPALEDLQKSEDERCLVIVDEVPIAYLDKKAKTAYLRLFNHCSSHKNTSVLICTQNYHSVPLDVRNACSWVTLYKCCDQREITRVASRVGSTPAMFNDLFSHLLLDRHDNLSIDMTKALDSPWRFRLNLYTPIFRIGEANAPELETISRGDIATPPCADDGEESRQRNPV